jgi:mRNA interferase RelE/StbE
MLSAFLSRIDALATNPRGEGCIKLSGQECYRVRQGIYRIIYEIVEDRLIVNVVKVAHRSSDYQGKPTLI